MVPPSRVRWRITGHHGRTRHPGRNGLVRPRRRVERDRVAERVPGARQGGLDPRQGERLGIQQLKAWKLLGPLVDNRVITLGTPSPASKKDIDQWVTMRGSSFQSAMRDIGTPALSRTRLFRVWNQYEAQLQAIFPH